MTFFWGLLAMAAGLAAGMVGFYFYFGGLALAFTGGQCDGAAVAIEALLVNSVVVAVLALAARLRRWNAIDYLALIWPSRRDLLLGLAVAVVLIAAMDGSSWLLGRGVVTPFQT